MNKDNKTLQEVLEELKVLKKKAKEEKICEPEKNDTPAEKEGLSDSSVKKDDEESYMISMKKHAMAMEREIREMKEYSDRLYDKIQDLRTALLEKQHVIDSVEELVKPLLDADSGADRHDVAEHILAVIKGSGEYSI